MKTLIYIIFIISAIQCNKKSITKNVSIGLEKKLNSLEGRKENDNVKKRKGILFDNEGIKLFYEITTSNCCVNLMDYGEQKLDILIKDKTLLTFNDSGGKVTTPFTIQFEKELFICFFEVFHGTGNISIKHIYHFDPLLNKLIPIEIESPKKILESIKSTDLLYLRKGFFYKNFEYDKSCFTKENTLPFFLVLYSKTSPDKNNGLEGYKILKGSFKLKKKENKFHFISSNIKLIPVNTNTK